jgi:hypothetical protein
MWNFSQRERSETSTGNTQWPREQANLLMRHEGLHPLGASKALNRRGQRPQESDNSDDNTTKDLLGKNVMTKPREREV